MKRASIPLTIYLCWITLALADPVLVPLENAPAGPEFNLPDLRDKTHSLQDYHGKVVLVNFWASWCPPCIHEMPALERLRETFGNEPFEILAINVGETKFRVWKFVRLVDFYLPVLLDTRKQLFEAWGMTVLPTSFLVDGSGRIRYWVQSAPQWDSEATLSIIRLLLQEQKNTQ
jgi:thiol-disulfide isomerase/thioredoxin